MAVLPDLTLTGKKVTGTNSTYQLIAASSKKKLAKMLLTQLGTNTLEGYVYTGTSANDDNIIAAFRTTSGKGTYVEFAYTTQKDHEGLNIDAGVFVKTVSGTCGFSAFTRKP